MQRLAFLSLTLFSVVSAWIPATTSTLTTRHCDVAGSTVRLQAVEQQQQQPSRLRFLQTVAAAAVTAVSVRQPIQPSWAAATETVVTLPNGVQYEVVKSGGSGIKPDVGELVAIRFAAYNGDVKIDDIFDTPEPYYTRLGSGGLLKGVEETLPLMQLGDRWRLTIPSNMAFGSKGRPASAGKPRIQANAVIVFEVEMVGLPGKEPELIELIGDV